VTRPTWSPPIPLSLVPTSDPGSHAGMPDGWTGLPLAPHPGAYGVRRRHHVHEGVDLYCPEGTPVSAMEDGRVTWVGPFTGPAAGSPWWLDTAAVMVEGASGAVLYGEVALRRGLAPGADLRRGDPIGHVVRVLRTDKGRPVTMLHIELHASGTVEPSEWVGDVPASLRDPTPLLMDAARRSWNPPGRPAFLKAGDRLVPISAVAGVGIADVEGARVRIDLTDGTSLLAEGFDAIEAVMLTRPSALEGRRLRWRRGAWALHNLLAHPAMQVLAWAGYGRLGVRLHDATTPVPRDPVR
jgi:hypothetical protein